VNSREIVMALEYLKQESKKQRRRLYDKARVVAEYVENLVKEVEGDIEEFELPWGYKVVKRRSSGGSFLYLVRDDGEDGYKYVDGGYGGGYYLAGDFSCWIPKTERETLIEFAEDIKQGWLEEVHAELTNRMFEDKEAADILEEAVAKEQDK